MLIGRYSCGADNEAPFPPGMPLPLLRSLIWLDYRLAVLFAVALPLVLLFWALSRREQALVRLLTLYWQVASLLGITVLLMVDARPVAYLTSAFASTERDRSGRRWCYRRRGTRAIREWSVRGRISWSRTTPLTRGARRSTSRRSSR